MFGENLGIEVVAEGIETQDQLDALQSLGCRLGQGFLFAKPVTADEAKQMIGICLGRGGRLPALTESNEVLELIEIQ
jgi:predicted signal transduction protein with EAL and GGDEF domain